MIFPESKTVGISGDTAKDKENNSNDSFSQTRFGTDKINTGQQKQNVIEVPTEGIVTKVGRNVPNILPIVFDAFNIPTVLPLSERLSTVYFTKEGVTVPKRKRGNTKITIHARNPAHIKKFVLTVKISTADMPRITYFPTAGINAIHMAAISILR